MDLCKFAEEYNDAWNAHNVDKVISYFADDGFLDDVPSRELTKGVENVRRAVSDWLAAFPDMHSQIEGSCVAADNVVAYEWRLKATNQGPFMGHEPTGSPIEFRGMAVLVVDADGKLTRHSDYVDSATILRQLGHLEA